MKERAEQIQEFALRAQLYLIRQSEPIRTEPSVTDSRKLVAVCASCGAISENANPWQYPRIAPKHEVDCEWNNLVRDLTEFLGQ